MIKNLTEINGWVLFLIFTTVYLVFTYTVQLFIFTDAFLEEQLQELYPAYMIEDIMEFKNRFAWVVYALEPVTLFLKLMLLFLPVSVAALLSDIDFKASDIFKAGLIAESVFAIQRFWFAFITWSNLDLLYDGRIVDKYPLSLIGLIGSENVVDWLIYPLQLLNLFEVAYIGVVSFLLMKRWKTTWLDTVNIVLPAYLAGLIIWAGFVVFITIQLP